MNQNQPLHLGFVLAGAVTAGAFTAGVLDYILDALRRWEERHQKDLQNIPKPNVVLDVMTGASAGSITAAITTIGLLTNKLQAVHDPNDPRASQNLLFDSWVNFSLPEGQEIIDEITNTNDLDRGELNSLLNTAFIDRLLNRLLDVVAQNSTQPLPKYVSQDLQVLMTLSNLRGIPIDLKLGSHEQAAHRMIYHKGFSHFTLGNNSVGNEALKLNPANTRNIELFLNCARASGAFPIGLRAVPFNDIPKEFVLNFIKNLFGQNSSWESRLDENYSFLAVDGGMTNNEPLSEAIQLLKQKGENYKMVLIDPFPGNREKENAQPYSTDNDSAFNIVPQLYSTLRNQILFKESDMAELFKDDSAKHMIWPSRFDESWRRMPNAIACGALSGFAGFLSRDFRVHDYMLGRKNAQNFIRNYFHSCDYTGWSEEYIQLFGRKTKDGQVAMPLIPDFLVERREEHGKYTHFYPNIENSGVLPDFPKVHYEKDIPQISNLLRKRIDQVAKVTYDTFVNREKKQEDNPILQHMNHKRWHHKIKKKTFQWVLNIGMRWFGLKELSRRAHTEVMNTIIRELWNHDLLTADHEEVRRELEGKS